jgi:hypothetical protein
MDLFGRAYDEIMVKRDECTFMLEVVCERLPDFCCYCGVIEHNISACKWLYPIENKRKIMGSKCSRRVLLE